MCIRDRILTRSQKSLQGILVVMHDITNLKQLENLRREFVANVSHELKTCLLYTSPSPRDMRRSRMPSSA
ncbi:hypothetical protein JMUB7527_28560 [Staphylococcus aureus]